MSVISGHVYIERACLGLNLTYSTGVVAAVGLTQVIIFAESHAKPAKLKPKQSRIVL
jgi:hypothetical protein